MYCSCIVTQSTFISDWQTPWEQDGCPRSTFHVLGHQPEQPWIHVGELEPHLAGASLDE